MALVINGELRANPYRQNKSGSVSAVSRPKSSIKRPYFPAYLSRASLAYRLDMAENTIDRLVAAEFLPEPIDIDGQKRWRWAEVEAAILATRNLTAASEEAYLDEVSEGIRNVTQENSNGAA